MRVKNKYVLSILFLLTLFYQSRAIPITDTLSIASTEQAKQFYRKGVLFGQDGKLDSALFYTQKAIELYENQTPKDSLYLAYSYQSLGIINFLLGKYEEAINFYNKAEDIYKLLKDEPLLAYIYGNKANIFMFQQDYSKAENHFFRSLAIFSNDTVKYRYQVAQICNNLGLIYLKIGKYKNASDYLLKSLFMKKDKKHIHTTLYNLALCNENIGNFKKAKKYHMMAIQNIKENYSEDNIWLAYQQMNYARFLSNRNRDTQEIKKYYYSALGIYKKIYGPKHPILSTCYNYLGEFYLNQNQEDSALYYFQQSLIALSEHFNNTNLAANPDINNGILSKTHLLTSLKNKAYALSQMAQVNGNLAYMLTSLQTYDMAIETIQKIRSGYLSEESKLYLAENATDIFSRAIEASYGLFQETGNDEFLNKAFYYCESGKSAILQEALQNNKALNIGGIPDSLITRERQLEKSIWTYDELIYEENKKKEPGQIKLDYWNKYLFEQKQEYATLSAYLENNFKQYHDLKHSKTTLHITDVQQKIGRGNALLEYYVSHKALYIIMVSPKESLLLKQNLDEAFFTQLDVLLSSLSDNNFSNHAYADFKQFQESSYYLYRVLLEPLSDKIQNKNLIIVPDGKLSYLPFEVLTTKNKQYKRINYKKLPYFVYTNNITYSYTAGFLFEEMHHKQNAVKKLGAFAPTYNKIPEPANKTMAVRQEYREKLFPLKGIQEEVKKISAIIGGDQYLGHNANERTFKHVAHMYDILHLAMHTILDDENPMYSKMAFTQDNDSLEDGFLNTYELYNMKLNSRMAVLSSCNSGSGKMQRGEGVMSLARGFIYSGCPSIIMTLWSVEDKSGVNLMTAFYKYLVQGKTKSESLQRSKIDFINHADQLHAHPYFWSGYVVIGNNKPLFHPFIKYAIFISCFLIMAVGLILFLRRRKRKKKSLKMMEFVFRDVPYN